LPLLVAITAVPSVSVNIFMPSMPGLVSAFSTDLKTVYFALTFYLAGLAAGQLAYGPLSDRFGRRPLLLIGLALYCAGSGLRCRLRHRDFSRRSGAAGNRRLLRARARAGDGP
jgi:MFS family permease